MHVDFFIFLLINYNANLTWSSIIMAAQDSQMRAYQVAGPGPFLENLELHTVARPSETPGKQEVLVEVAIAGLNPVDYKLVEMGLASRAMLSYPNTPGLDFGGVAVAVGAEIQDIKPGDRVMGRIDPMRSPGTLSEYIVAPYEGVVKLPPGVPLPQAGATATTALTAYQTIAPYVKAGDKVFINGGSGGVGTFGIQVAKALGCHVTVTCSTAKLALCKELGADEIIDYKTTNVTAALKEKGPVFAVAVDNVGNSPPDLISVADSFLLPEGRYKHVGGSFTSNSFTNVVASTLVPQFLGGPKHKLEIYFTKNSHEDMAQIVEWMDQGKVKTIVDAVFGFDELQAAYEKLKEGSSTGKIVIQVKKGLE